METPFPSQRRELGPIPCDQNRIWNPSSMGSMFSSGLDPGHHYHLAEGDLDSTSHSLRLESRFIVGWTSWSLRPGRQIFCRVSENFRLCRPFDCCHEYSDSVIMP